MSVQIYIIIEVMMPILFFQPLYPGIIRFLSVNPKLRYPHHPSRKHVPFPSHNGATTATHSRCTTRTEPQRNIILRMSLVFHYDLLWRLYIDYLGLLSISTILPITLGLILYRHLIILLIICRWLVRLNVVWLRGVRRVACIAWRW